ncbi:fungal-specific transcription factor domain-containing protein [Sphaerosporella brunnea]|uniref:Fungal-specific transcription factor domain-containing protein n=1 Tax=Sphaerosporella brunnea TaxID=1250544 RepID=A0A5J5F679_9PEZI|nr:fungal-specific transcription factor domain-containing protein [Sphaerosporella brunnea]
MMQVQSQQSKKHDAAAAFQHILTLSTSAVAQAAQKQKRSYKCGHCSTAFRRSEHCVRHERSHTLEKPFGCSVCGCRFSRKDLLVRHERTVHSSSRTVIADSSRPAKRQRTNSLPGDALELVISPAAVAPNQQTTADGRVDITAMPRRASECFVDLSPISPTEIQADARRSSVFSSHDGAQPLTPPESDSSDHTVRNRTTSPLLSENNKMDFGGMQTDMDFSIFFQAGDSKDDGALGSEGLGQSLFASVTAAINGTFSESEQQFAGFEPLDGIREETSPQDSSMTDLFREAAVDGMTPIEEFIIPQTPVTAMRERTSKTSNYPFVSSMAKTQTPSVVIDDATRDWIMQDLAASHPRELLNTFCLPNARALQRYLDSYFKSFHKTFPILHMPTFYPKGTKALLLLSVCCIGAQYCLEKRRARYLFEWTKRFLTIEDVKWKRVEVERKTWLVRSKLLLGFFGIWGAERELVADALAEQGSYASYFRHAQNVLLRREEIPLEQQTWRDWVDIESFKRLCYGIFSLQAIISITFNLQPAVCCSDLRLPLPAAEDLWEAVDANAWESNRNILAPGLYFEEAMEYCFGANSQGDPSSPECGPTAFGGLILVYGLLLQQWQVTQCRQSLQLFGFTTPTISPFTIAQESEKLLGRLHKCLIYTHQNIGSTAGGLLWFAAAGLLRQAYIRQFTQFDQASVRMRTIIRPDEASVDMEAVMRYVMGGIARCSAVTRAAEKATEALEMPIRAGHFMVCKTAALMWSVDHVIAGWDCILFLLRWMFTLETRPRCDWDGEEVKVYNNIQRLLEETDLDLNTDGPMTPSLAALFGDLLADTWVWGITCALGNGMRMLSERLQAAHDGF